MKKTVFIVLTLILSFPFLSSCSKLEKTYTFSYPQVNTSSTLSESSAQESDSVVSEPPQEVVDIHSLMEKNWPQTLSYPVDQLYDDFARIVKVKEFKKIDEKTLYSINDTKQGGKLIVFYTNIEGLERELINWFYVEKKLSYSDFQGISPGMSIYNVIKIDPSVQLVLNKQKSELYPYEIFESVTYLTDGLLYITYEDDGGTMKIINCMYKSDFYLHTANCNGRGHGDFYGTILPEDWERIE